MGFCFGFWDKEKTSVDACYLISKFCEHSSSSDILWAFLDGIKELNLSAVAEILMEVSTINLKFFKSFKMYHLQCELPKLINVGRSGLHLVHGVFKSGTEATSWELKNNF